MSDRPSSDVLSLTLPKALGRARSRRRFRPPWRFWFYLAFCVWYAVLGVWTFADGRHFALTAVDAAGAGLNWRIALSVRHGGWVPFRFVPLLFAMVPAAIGAGFLP